MNPSGAATSTAVPSPVGKLVAQRYLLVSHGPRYKCAGAVVRMPKSSVSSFATVRAHSFIKRYMSLVISRLASSHEQRVSLGDDMAALSVQELPLEHVLWHVNSNPPVRITSWHAACRGKCQLPCGPAS